MIWKMCRDIRDLGCSIGKRCVLLPGVDGIADDEQLAWMGCRIAPRTLSTRQGQEAYRCEGGDCNVFFPVGGGLARGQQGFKVQAIEPTCDDEDAIAVVNQVLCRLYQHLVKIA